MSAFHRDDVRDLVVAMQGVAVQAGHEKEDGNLDSNTAVFFL